MSILQFPTKPQSPESNSTDDLDDAESTDPYAGWHEFVCNCGHKEFRILRKPNEISGSVYCNGCNQESTGWFQ